MIESKVYLDGFRRLVFSIRILYLSIATHPIASAKHPI
jgi:hypothetical protein